LPPPPWGQPSWPGNGDFAAQSKPGTDGKDFFEWHNVRDAWKDVDIQGHLSRVSDKGPCFPTIAVVINDLNRMTLMLVGDYPPSPFRALTSVLARGEYDARLAPNPNSVISLTIDSLPGFLPRKNQCVIGL
jgi:hypothetical protein